MLFDSADGSALGTLGSGYGAPLGAAPGMLFGAAPGLLLGAVLGIAKDRLVAPLCGQWTA